MKVVVEDIGNSMINVELGLSSHEIGVLIARLQMLQSEPDQHFHISSNFDGSCKLGDLTFYVKEAGDADDIFISGKALGPGDSINSA